MNTTHTRLLAFLAAALLAACGRDAARDAEHADHTNAEHEEHDDHHEGASALIVLDEATLRANGVVVERAAEGTVRTEIDLPGEIVLNADRVAHIVPRFPGVVQEVRKNLGDRVEPDEVLAVIQSNVSVAPYEMKSMIAGSVIEKHLTLGEYVRDDADVFIVADLSTVWVNVSVYARFLADVRPGLPVRITSPGLSETASGVIDYVGPLVGESTRTGVARLVLPNPHGRWQPGLFVTAHIAVTESRGNVVVPDEAVQTVAGRPVVFVRHDGGFMAREVSLGERGGGMVAITHGLAPGEAYVAQGSFIFKADLGKAEAEHSH